MNCGSLHRLPSKPGEILTYGDVHPNSAFERMTRLITTDSACLVHSSWNLMPARRGLQPACQYTPVASRHSPRKEPSPVNARRASDTGSQMRPSGVRSQWVSAVAHHSAPVSRAMTSPV